MLPGAVGRLLDIYTQNPGNIFSQMAIRILFGVLISVYSSSVKRAMFCIGMLIAYYLAAFLTKGFFAKHIAGGIVPVPFLSSVLLFDRIRIHDIIINGIMTSCP